MPAQTIWPNDNLLEIDFPMESVLLLLLFVARLIVKFCVFFCMAAHRRKTVIMQYVIT